MTLGVRIRALREEKKLRQEDLGHLFSVSKSAVSQWENDIRTPDMDIIIKLSDYFSVTTDYLLGQTNERNDVHKRIESALTSEPDADELISFWREMKEREDLKLLFKQVRPLSDDSIRRVIRVIQAIELEESQE